MATGPSFYKIDFERENVFQGKTTSFLSIRRDETVMSSSEKLYVIVYPQANTFETAAAFSASGDGSSLKLSISTGTAELNSGIGFNKIASGQKVKEFWRSGTNTEVTVTDVDYRLDGTIVVSCTGGGSFPVDALAYQTGEYDVDSSQWKINGYNVQDYSDQIEGNQIDFSIYLDNPFDGSTGGVQNTYFGQTGTGFYGRGVNGWAVLPYNSNNTENNSITYRIDYEGSTDSHVKLNFLIVRSANPPASFLPNMISGWTAEEAFGFKSYNGGQSDIDYQEVHLFGYTETPIRTSRTTYQNQYPLATPIYEDSYSYGLLKTNPKLSGNVKLTVDNVGALWLNSFNANDELSDVAYKKYKVSPKSNYSMDLYNFFKKGKTPRNIVFDLYQKDELYYSTKRNLFDQYDNFYNYGVEQLSSNLYEEQLSFLAPIWLRRDLPDYFVIFRIPGPLSEKSYVEGTTPNERFVEAFENSSIVKTYDMREGSNLGTYLRNVVNDNRFRDRPVQVSYEENTPTNWRGFCYEEGTMSYKGEFLSEFWKQDRAIIETEEYITSGFERNGVICYNLMNLEFLFTDDEATDYSINRYIGFYVKENQLAEFELDPTALSKIVSQTPIPKAGVDAQPFTTRTFTQTNPNGIVLPVDYYHNTTTATNTTNIPVKQGLVNGKFPLPSMVDDPLRFFYVKDRDGVLKRVDSVREVDYGVPGTNDYKRVTEIRLQDNEENISKYGGVNQITSQISSELLNEGDAQLVIDLLKTDDANVLAEGEELQFSPLFYELEEFYGSNVVQVIETSPGYADFYVYSDNNQSYAYTDSTFVQPSAIGQTVTISLANSYGDFVVGDVLYVTLSGYYIVEDDLGSGNYLVRLLGLDQLDFGDTSAYTKLIVSKNFVGVVSNSNDPDNPFPLREGVELQVLSTISDGAIFSFDIQKDNLISSRLLSPDTGSYSVIYNKPSTKSKWILKVNNRGLSAGDAWEYPNYDPTNDAFITNISGEGSVNDVANAIVSGINTFDNIPVVAYSSGSKVYIKSTLRETEGNTILFSRSLVRDQSRFSNLGIYEAGNVSWETTASQIDTAFTSTEDLNPTIKENDKIYGSNTYLFRIYKDLSGYSAVYIWIDGALTSLSAAQDTNTTQSYNIDGLSFDVENIPFTLDFTDVPAGVTSYYAFSVSNNIERVEQLFIGGSSRRRNRARIGSISAEQFGQDRKITLQTQINAGSDLLTPSTIQGIYVGALVSGNGIPSGSRVVEILEVDGKVRIDNDPAQTISSLVTYGIGSSLRDTVEYQKWFQVQKQMYDRLKGWSVQGKYIYSLPYLEEPTYDVNGFLNGFTNQDSFSIIQLENERYEFYRSNTNDIVAYTVYRPAFGILSFLPIRTFDFDYYVSDYSYTPTLETLRYFFDERAAVGEYVELPLYENWKVKFYDTAQESFVAASGSFSIDAYDKYNQTWVNVETLSIDMTQSGLTGGFYINTYYPLYTYDYQEYPYTVASADPQVLAAGLRNYNRRYLNRTLTDGTIEKYTPTKFRISCSSMSAGNQIRVSKSDYSEDKDRLTFSGFAGIQEILNNSDLDAITALKSSGDYVGAFVYQLLVSEYDRLRENFNTAYAVRSKVVPYINKWSLEGTDSRDNYYRLDNSAAFGISNLSSSGLVGFTEPLALTQEFPYLDGVPKDYSDESIFSSRSYQFAKLSDLATGTASWYKLLTTDNTNDWFTKYFTTGYPSEIMPDGITPIDKPREERYTFFRYNNGLGRSETLFRGAKMQIIDYTLDVNGNILEESDNSEKYDGYKFSAIQRTIPFTPFVEEPPYEIDIYKNESHKSILFLITERSHDYRTQSGLSDYASKYFGYDQLKNSGRQQVDFTNSSSFGQFTGGSLVNPSLSAYLPYIGNAQSGLTGLPNNTYARYSTSRPAQGFFGAGYLELDHTRLGGNVNLNTAPPQVSGQRTLFKLDTTESGYVFSANTEINTTLSSYLGLENVLGATALNVKKTNFWKDSSLFNLHVLGGSTGSYVSQNYYDARTINIRTFPDQLSFSSGSKLLFVNTSTSSSSLSNASKYYSTFVSGNPYSYPSIETYNLYGGSGFTKQRQQALTFSAIKNLVMEGSPLVKYHTVGSSIVDYTITFVNEDFIKLENTLFYTVDEQKPIEYISSPVIGFNIASQNLPQVLYRHRGFFEPKPRDIISFWVREDQSFTEHFEKDFLLSNTHINTRGVDVATIKNYGINKVSPREVLQISGNSYRSLYPLIGEVSIDKRDAFTLDSTWDNNFYRRYSNTIDYVNLSGLSEMREIKSFMLSKAMKTPNSYDIQQFNSSEASFEVISPQVSIGVEQLASDTAASKSSSQGSSLSTLLINLDLQARLKRQIVEDMKSGLYVDEFSKLQTYTPEELRTLSETEVENLRSAYVDTNIIPLFEVSSIVLYKLNASNIPVLEIDLTEAEKIGAGYRPDKDFVVTKVSDFVYTINKKLDSKENAGFSVGCVIRRI